MCCIILLCIFFNILRSFRVCVRARVFVHAYESGRNYIHACNKKVFECIMFVENETPPCGESWLRACSIIANISFITCYYHLYNTIATVVGRHPFVNCSSNSLCGVSFIRIGRITRCFKPQRKNARHGTDLERQNNKQRDEMEL